MKFVFLKINDQPADYAFAKLDAVTSFAGGITPQISNWTVDNALSQLMLPAPVIALKEQFFQTDRKQNVVIEASMRCAIQELVSYSPLLDGEEILEDFFSYLLEPYGGCPAYTAVLERTTNKAKILYIFEDVQIDGGHVVKLTSQQQPTIAYQPKVALGAFVITEELVKQMLKKAAVAGLSKVGAIVLNLVMEAIFGKADDTAKLIEEVKKVTREEIEANELAKLDGIVSGTLMFLANEYKLLKEKADLSKVADRERLTNLLTPYNHQFYTEVIGLLQTAKYSRKGLYTYLIASSVHLIITQELALVDPNSFNPNDSSYLITLNNNAKLYRTHVETEYNNAITERGNKIEQKEYLWVDCMGNSCVRERQLYWYDSETNEESRRFTDKKGDDRPASERVQEDMNNHKNYVLGELRKSIGNPENNYIPEIKNLETYKFS